MKRNMLFGAGAAALACLLGGCRLAVPQGAAGQDTLIGGYATWESIPYFSEHFLSGDRSPAHLYADWSSADRPEGAQWRNIFPNVTGYALCQNTAEEDGDTVYLGSGADPYFSGLAYNSAHNGSETTESMTGTLYADIGQIGGDITGFTFSPVYQTADGQIYLAEGQRVTCSTQIWKVPACPSRSARHRPKAAAGTAPAKPSRVLPPNFPFCMLPKRCGCCRWMRIMGYWDRPTTPPLRCRKS